MNSKYQLYPQLQYISKKEKKKKKEIKHLDHFLVWKYDLHTYQYQ